MSSVEKTPAVRVRWTADLADGVQDLAWSPDGRWLAAAAVSGPLVVIDGATCEIHREWSWSSGLCAAENLG